MPMMSVAVTTAVGGVGQRHQPAEGVGAGTRIRRGRDDVLRRGRHPQHGEPVDERRAALLDVAVQALADEPEPPVSELGQMVDRHADPGPVVDVHRVHTVEGLAGPQRDDRDLRGGEVVEQTRLVAHVAEQDDRVAVACLQHGVELDRLVGLAVGAAQHDVVAALAGPHRDGLHGVGEERIGDLPDDDPEQHRLGPAESAGQRVRPVPQPVGGLEHPLPGVGGDRHRRDGVVQDPRHRRLRDPREAGDVLHRHGAVGSSLTVVRLPVVLVRHGRPPRLAPGRPVCHPGGTGPGTAAYA